MPPEEPTRIARAGEDRTPLAGRHSFLVLTGLADHTLLSSWSRPIAHRCSSPRGCAMRSSPGRTQHRAAEQAPPLTRPHPGGQPACRPPAAGENRELSYASSMGPRRRGMGPPGHPRTLVLLPVESSPSVSGLEGGDGGARGGVTPQPTCPLDRGRITPATTACRTPTRGRRFDPEGAASGRE